MNAKIKVAIKFYVRLIGGYLTFFGVVLTFSLLLGKFIEALFVILGYFSTRFVVPQIKHFSTTKKCICVSTLTFLFALVIVCLPRNVAVIWAIMTGATIPLFMYAEHLLLDIKKSDKELLIERCKALNYNTMKTKIAVKFFIDKEKPKQVWEWLCEKEGKCIEYDSVYQMKWRMKKELFKNNSEKN